MRQPSCKTILSLRDSGRVHLSSHFQAVEALHVADGFGQNMSRLHGGHLPARLRQVAELTEPCLSKTKSVLLSLAWETLLKHVCVCVCDACCTYVG